MKIKHLYQAEAGAGEGSAGAAPVIIDPAAHAALQAELDRFKAKHGESEKHLKEQEKAARLATEEAAKKSGDIAALEKSWGEKLAAEVATRDGQLTAYQATISNMTAGAAARTMAAELSLPGSADVLLPHIERRLKVEMTDGAPLIRVLDKAGKPSAMSIDDLKKEISAEKSFAPLLVGSNASGSGNPGSKDGAVTGSTVKRAAFDVMSPAGKMAHIKAGGKVID